LVRIDWRRKRNELVAVRFSANEQKISRLRKPCSESEKITTA